MSQVQIPSPGQPLDVSYIATLARAFNDLDTSVASQNTSATSKVGANTTTARKTSSLTFAGETLSVTLNKVDKDNIAFSGTWTHQGIPFNASPVVVGTIVSTASSVANKELVLIIKNTTTTSTTFDVIALNGVSQSYAISINFIAIGTTS